MVIRGILAEGDVSKTYDATILEIFYILWYIFSIYYILKKYW